MVEAVHVANGPNWRLLRLRSDADVLAARPQARGPAGTDIGLAGPCAAGSAIDWELRAVFANQRGEMVEDPVTGSFNAGLAMHLFAEGKSRPASFLAIVPGLRADYKRTETFRRDPYGPEDIVDFTDDEAFFAALEALPCCVTNESGSKAGDPLNLVIIGGIEDAFPALIRRGWSPSETTWSGSVMQMMSSALARERYPYAPISNLYLYGRPQDLALQKARDNIHQRNHLRLWRSPMRYHGKQVWVGQISRDIGSRLTIHSPTLTTHKIDPDVDGAALALAEDVVYSQGLRKLAFVAGVGAAPRGAPRFNLTRDPYVTAGMRTILFFDHSPTSLKDIEIVPWAGGTATRR